VDAPTSSPSSAPAVDASIEEGEGGQQREDGKRKKRRKVRSRQKNIYKDRRDRGEKPSHLVPGNKDYRGRPLTAETRAKLNLEKRTTTTATQRRNNGDEDGKNYRDAGSAERNTGVAKKEEGEKRGNLAVSRVGDPVDYEAVSAVDNKNRHSGSTSKLEKDNKRKTKRETNKNSNTKRPKYKNLVL